MSKSEVNLGKKGLIITSLIFLAAGVFCFFMWKSSAKEYKSSKNWPSVSGTIIKSSIIQKREWDSKKKKYKNTFYPNLQYTYGVNGVNYVGSRITFSDYASNSRKAIRKILRKYPNGAQVKVYYNPKNPAKSVLEKRLGIGGYMLFLVSVMFFIGGLLLLFLFIKKIFSGV